jgi:hypothetical protein
MATAFYEAKQVVSEIQHQLSRICCSTAKIALLNYYKLHTILTGVAENGSGHSAFHF